MNIVIYARFSSHSQTEQSIEGQLKECYAFAHRNGYTVVGEYIDRAISGTAAENRPEFLRMIADSSRKQFDAVLVYQLDRFARNRFDSATYKAKLRKNGVRVVSARENISEDASGILVEGVLESMAEYYSAELSQKIRRGMNINAEKCLSNGSNPGLGFRIMPDKSFEADPLTAPIVRRIFERYANGTTVTEIIDELNNQGVKTSNGGAFNKNSLHRMLHNKRYIGYYIYKGDETPDKMPRLIEDELFYKVQDILKKNKKAPARARAKEEYILTTKLFCGYCREMMTGYGGTSKTGRVHHYYICNSVKRKANCKKKTVRKEYIEDLVVNECRKLLTDKNIDTIAKEVVAICEADFDDSMVKQMRSKVRELDSAIENLWKALESGQGADAIMERINQRTAERSKLEAQIMIDEKRQITLTLSEIKFFMQSLKKGNINGCIPHSV